MRGGAAAFIKHEGISWYRAETDAVISNLNLEIGPNQIIGLVGLNGAGKSTPLHVLSGIHRHYSLERSAVEERGNFADKPCI